MGTKFNPDTNSYSFIAFVISVIVKLSNDIIINIGYCKLSKTYMKYVSQYIDNSYRLFPLSNGYNENTVHCFAISPNHK